MAMPIKETPVLTGRTAKAFIKKAEATAKKGPDIRERERVLAVYNQVLRKHGHEYLNV